MARKILLADDSVTAQNMGRRILTDAGYEVITVNNGSAALKKIAESKPDLIILDVYMPGYGGLEVCQRLKEAQETARIPVLLSVGKLEPFKVEEARRVRADGHIVKPFEASELLTALTKLEDKIVPQAESFKNSRFAKAIAFAEQSTTTQGIGEDSGWQNRLTIPRGTPKPEEPERQEPQPASVGLREIAEREESKSAALKSMEAAVGAALPQGITAEELAALAAAASSFVDKRETGLAKPAEAEFPAVKSSEDKPEAKSELPVESADAVTFASSPTLQNETQNEARKVVQTAAQAAELQRATTDAEVLAALASLSPIHAEAPSAREFAGNNGGKAGTDRGEGVAVTVGASIVEREIAENRASGPRWIAQAVAVGDDESTLILEREMEKAYAAMAALDADKDKEKEKTSAPAVAETQASVAGEAGSLAAANADSAVSAAEVYALAGEPASAKREEPVPSPEVTSAAAAEAVPGPEAIGGARVPELNPAEAVAALGTSSAAAENVTASNETVAPAANENAAYAAAASAGVSESGMQAENAVAAAVPGTGESTTAPAAGGPGRESELAAAWQTWKQIRESMLDSQGPKDKDVAAAAGFAAGEFKDIRQEQPEAEAASEAGLSESAAIANIVDSVLAELKPKLMEEISRKMGKDKKKK